MKLFIIQFSPASYYFLPLGPKYSTDHRPDDHRGVVACLARCGGLLAIGLEGAADCSTGINRLETSSISSGVQWVSALCECTQNRGLQHVTEYESWACAHIVLLAGVISWSVDSTHNIIRMLCPFKYKLRVQQIALFHNMPHVAHLLYNTDGQITDDRDQLFGRSWSLVWVAFSHMKRIKSRYRSHLTD